MFEKVNPQHPDKVADRIAGAVVDLAYTKADNPKIAVEVLLGHGECTVMIEASVMIWDTEVEDIVHRIAGNSILVHTKLTSQDIHLANNQQGAVRCGDNGIFKGCDPFATIEGDDTRRGYTHLYRANRKATARD